MQSQAVLKQIRIINPGLYIFLELSNPGSQTQKDLENIRQEYAEEKAYIRAVVEYCMRMTQQEKVRDTKTEQVLWELYERAQEKKKKRRVTSNRKRN